MMIPSKGYGDMSRGHRKCDGGDCAKKDREKCKRKATPGDRGKPGAKGLNDFRTDPRQAQRFGGLVYSDKQNKEGGGGQETTAVKKVNIRGG